MPESDPSEERGPVAWFAGVSVCSASPWTWPAAAIAALASAALVALAAIAGDGPQAAIQLIAILAWLMVIGTLIRDRTPAQATPLSTGVDRHLDVDPLEDKRWLELVEGCVGIIDELDIHRSNFDLAAQELAEHLDFRFQEILERSGVTVIADEATFDRGRHQPERGAAQARPGDTVVETLRPGLAVGRRVFRRAVVRLSNLGSDAGTGAAH